MQQKLLNFRNPIASTFIGKRIEKVIMPVLPPYPT